jgi:hypothetical protein
MMLSPHAPKTFLYSCFLLFRKSSPFILTIEELRNLTLQLSIWQDFMQDRSVEAAAIHKPISDKQAQQEL